MQKFEVTLTRDNDPDNGGDAQSHLIAQVDAVDEVEAEAKARALFDTHGMPHEDHDQVSAVAV